MGKFTLRIGFLGFVLACVFFAASRWLGRSASLDHFEAVLWPTSILPLVRTAPVRLTIAGFLTALFSALLNGAYYFGLAWLAWWVARLAGIAKREPSPQGRFVSFFLGIGFLFSLLVAAAEAAIHWPREFSARDLFAAYLISANLFALVVLVCGSSGWALWRLRAFFGHRAAGIPRP
jgi:hypothetical protein